jgi:hemoglobin/transferrin/lactoferrin receptor protein
MWKAFIKIIYPAAAVLIALASPMATAEEESKAVKIPKIETTVIVTATRTEIDADMISKPVTVIDSEVINSSNASSVLDLLDSNVPGVSFARGGAIGGQVSFRGFNSNDLKSPLFIDGDRFHGRNTLEYLLLNPDRVERIEIIRGPAATMYGTDAMGGLINVITRKAKGETDKAFSLTPRLRSMEYSTSGNLRSTSIELQGIGRKFDMLLSANGKKAENYGSPDGEIQSSDLALLLFDARIGYTPAKGHRIELSAKYAHVEHSMPGGLSIAPGYPYKIRRQDPMTEKSVKLSYIESNKTLGFEHIEASFYARYLYTDNYGEVRPKVNPFSQVTKTDNYVDGPLGLGGKLFGTHVWKGKNALTTGMDWFRDSRNALQQEITKYNAQGNVISATGKTVSSPAEVQTNIGLFALNDWNPSNQWTVSAGGRIDYFKTGADVVAAYKGVSETTDWPVTGSIGAVYRPISIVHFTANVSTSFRTPIAFEKFGTLLGYEPTPDLKPEKGITYELGTRLRLSRVNSNLTVFQGNYSDLIMRTTVDSTIYPGTRAQKAMNIGKARIRGVEFDATWLANTNWKVFLNAAYLHGTNTLKGVPLSYIAPLNGLIGLRYTPNNEAFYVEATERWASRKDRIDAASERETGGYGVLNLHAGYNLKKLSSVFPDMELRLSLDNILDKAYSNAVTPEDISYGHSITNPLLEPGRRFSISLRSRL